MSQARAGLDNAKVMDVFTQQSKARAMAQVQALKAVSSTTAGSSTAGGAATGQTTANTGVYTPYAVAFNYQEAMQAVAAIQDNIAAERSAPR